VTGGPGLVKLVKIGTGTFTLNGDHNAYGSDTNVEGGKMTITTTIPNLSDLADVRVLTGAQLELNYAGTDFIDSLFLGGTQVAAGEWGSLTSAALNKSALLLGLGTLTVQTGPGSGALVGTVPEPGMVGLLVVAGLFGVGARYRRWNST
jgi:autotransporter-associated beta strand protein